MTDSTTGTHWKQLVNLDSFNLAQTCVNMIDADMGFVTADDDRFGIFFDNPNKTLSLSDLHTERSFAEITDLTAQTYAGKNAAVCWSGGVDSSLIVAALNKHNIDFKVTVMPNQCRLENPDMYDWVLKNCTIIELDEATSFNNLYDHVSSGGSTVSGDPADQLYPSFRYNLLPGHLEMRHLYSRDSGYGDNLELLTQTYPPEQFYNNLQDRLVFKCQNVVNEFDVPETFTEDVCGYINDRLFVNNLRFSHHYQLKWLVKFIFRYNKNIQRMTRTLKNRFFHYNRDPVDIVHYDFFDTIDYQSWAWTNLDEYFDTQAVNALTHKMEAKEYIADVTQLPSQLNLVKIPSL